MDRKGKVKMFGISLKKKILEQNPLMGHLQISQNLAAGQ